MISMTFHELRQLIDKVDDAMEDEQKNKDVLDVKISVKVKNYACSRDYIKDNAVLAAISSDGGYWIPISDTEELNRINTLHRDIQIYEAVKTEEALVNICGLSRDERRVLHKFIEQRREELKAAFADLRVESGEEGR